MRRLLLSIALLFGLVAPVLVAQPAAAVDVLDPVCQQARDNGAEPPAICRDNRSTATESPITGTLKVVLDMLSIVAGVAAVIMIIISGLRFIISGDDSSSVAAARRGLLFAIIGLVIVALAQVIVPFILKQVL